MTAKQSVLDQAIADAYGQMAKDVPIIGERLKGEVQTAGANRVSRPELLARMHRNWPDANYRAGLLKQYGPEEFTSLAQDMVKKFGHPSGFGLVPNLAMPEGNVPSPTPNPPSPIPTRLPPMEMASPSEESQ